MQHITPKNRQQYEFVNLEDFIDKNNPVRFVDAFIDKLELDKLGFNTVLICEFVQRTVNNY
jgi:hypothetical protein